MSDENTKYVPEGVILLCSNGNILTQLICDPQPINLYGVRYADENDNKPELNIPSFVTCKTKGACAPPAPLKWIKVKENVTLHGFRPLLDESECVCEYGQGLIKIFFDKYAAEVALDDNNLSDFVAEPISSNILGMLGGGLLGMFSSDYREGVGQGLKQGAQGTWNFLTHDLWQAETWKGFGKMAVIGGVYLSNSQNPLGTLQSDMMLRSLDARYGTDFTQTRDALAEGLERTGTRVVEDVKHGNLKSIGRDVGQVEYAVVEAVVGTKGAGLALKGAKTAAELAIGAERLAQIALKSAEVLEKIKFGLRGIVRIGTKADEAIDEVAKVSKRLEYLGRTPGKASKTGREVFDRMVNEGTARTRKGIKEFWDPDNKVWRNIKEADMGHTKDAVTWWNETGRKYGAKSKEVREWMLDPDNYEYEYFRTNRSRGARLNETYKPPLK